MAFITDLNDIDKIPKVSGFNLFKNRFLILLYKCWKMRITNWSSFIEFLFLILIILFYKNISNLFADNLNLRKPTKFSSVDSTIYEPFGYFENFNISHGYIDSCLWIDTIYYGCEIENCDFFKNVLENAKLYLNNLSCSTKSLNYEKINYTTMINKKFNLNDFVIFPAENFNSKNFNYSIIYFIPNNVNSYGPYSIDVTSNRPPKFSHSNFNERTNFLHYLLSIGYTMNVTGLNLNELPKVLFEYMPYPPYENEEISSSLLFYKLSSYFFVLIFIYHVIYIITIISDEKKNKSIKFLRLMGSTNFEIYLAYFCNFFISMLIIEIIFIIYFFYVNNALFTSFSAITLIILLVFNFQLITFSFLLISIFKKEIWADLFYFFIAILSFQQALSLDLQNSYNFSYIFLFLLFPYNYLYFALSFLYELVKFNEKSNLEILFIFLNKKSHLNLIRCIGISIFVTIIQISLLIFLLNISIIKSQVLKLLKNSTKYENVNLEAVSDCSNTFIEINRSSSKPLILLTNICKSFKTSLFENISKKVLHNLNFKIYSNQITILLGHNGAGKTTLMNIISGLDQPDSGKIFCKEKAINSSQITRKVLGYCPQENIFINCLSVYDNLKIGAILKGIPFYEVDNLVKFIISEIGLFDKMHDKTKNLSGGMKRRLCLGCSIVGHSDALIFDEPTSGLDPETRRSIWDVLLKLRKKKTILITTHFMEEAEILGDKIAIMQSGKIKYYGSLLFLKKLFNVGYILGFEIKPNCNITALSQYVENFIPKVSLKKKNNTEVFYKLPIENSENKSQTSLNLIIANLLESLEHDKKDLNIISIRISNTSLEEIFLRIDADDRNSEEVKTEFNSIEYLNFYQNIENFEKFSPNWFKALIYKRLKISINNKILFFHGFLVFTVMYCLIGFIYYKTMIGFKSFDNYKTILYDFKENYGIKKSYFIYSSLDEKNYIFKDNVLKNLRTNFGLDLQLVDTKDKNVDDFAKKFILDIGKNDIKSYKYDTLLAISRYKIKDLLVYKMWINKSANYAIQISISLFFSSFINFLTQQSNTFITVSENFYKTDYENGLLEICLESTHTLNFIVLMVFLAYYIFLPVLIRMPINEKEQKVRLIESIFGLSNSSYWISNFIYDLCYLLTITFIGFIIFMIFCLKVFIANYFDFLIIYFFFILCGISSILMVYVISCFNLNLEPSKIIIRMLLTGGYVFTIYWFSKICLTETYFSSDYVLASVIIPIFNFKAIIFYFVKKQIIKYNYPNLSALDYKEMQLNAFAFLLINSFISCFLIWVLNFNRKQNQKNIEFLKLFFKRFKLLFCCNQSSNIESNYQSLRTYRSNKSTFENILKEVNYIEETLKDKNTMDPCLIVDKIHKKFKNYSALKKVSFTVKNNECFGLLGTNGAGKSTLYSILTQDQFVTSGDFYLKRICGLENINLYYRLISYCPQIDSLNFELTVEQTFIFYIKLIGYPNELELKVAKFIIQTVDLLKYENILVGYLSGGNKRKVCIGISLIGKKEFIFLDEPTTGMDPVSRRKQWKAITLYKNIGKRSFLLTSHSMEECENLCDRIAIMVSGEIKCLGSYSELLSEYAQGYTLLIKLNFENMNTQNIENIKKHISQMFNNKITFNEYHLNTMIYILRDEDYHLQWSEVFKKMENLKNYATFDDYLISRTNLEQIFLSFANS